MSNKEIKKLICIICVKSSEEAKKFKNANFLLPVKRRRRNRFRWQRSANDETAGPLSAIGKAVKKKPAANYGYAGYDI